MVRTAEARWFFRGRASAAQIAWFTRGAPVKREKKRIDRYLSLAGSRVLGVKQREGKLEVKALAAPPRAFRVAGVAGRKDQWVKWPLPLTQKPRLAGRWLAVGKARLVLSARGCDVELASIVAFRRRYFSLGFEAASAAILDRTLARFFAERGPMPGARLAAAASLSYPAWLASAAPASSPARRSPSPGRRAPR